MWRPITTYKLPTGSCQGLGRRFLAAGLLECSGSCFGCSVGSFCGAGTAGGCGTGLGSPAYSLVRKRTKQAAAQLFVLFFWVM